ncbi:MAG TPA: hypothetical protein VK654_01385 [Nitrospirota bacterium]|nr:hypothetical protein [Nitrospirota bacterium]
MSLSNIFNFDSYFNKILPVVPILYAIVYEVLERRKSRKAGSSPALREEAKTVRRSAGTGITPGSVIAAVAVSFIIKFFLEVVLTLLFFKFSGESFSNAYGAFSFKTIGQFLRGEHPWISEREGIYLLALLYLATIMSTGLWIGYTARGSAIVEGVLAGAVVALINSMTNMLYLYRSIEAAAERLVDSMGYVTHAGFLVVLALQVLLFGLLSGLVQIAKEERALRRMGARSKA